MMKRMVVAGMSLALILGGLVPAEALPVINAIDASATGPAGLQKVRDRRFYHGHHFHHHGGYHGYYHHHHHHNGAGAVIGGLAAGAIIGGLLSSQARPGPRASHAQWCYDRYRSYRSSDNTFQPNVGPRRQCVSP